MVFLALQIYCTLQWIRHFGDIYQVIAEARKFFVLHASNPEPLQPLHSHKKNETKYNHGNINNRDMKMASNAYSHLTITLLYEPSGMSKMQSSGKADVQELYFMKEIEPLFLILFQEVQNSLHSIGMMILPLKRHGSVH